jgi:hypothetical protein
MTSVNLVASIRRQSERYMKHERRSSLTLRLPQELHAWVVEQAKKNFTSQNDEIIRLIRVRMQAATGEGFADTAPVAVTRTRALQGSNSTNGL